VKKIAAFVLVLFVGVASADDKKDAKKIEADKLVGKWELLKDAEPLPKGTVLELTKDGKLTLVIEIDGKKLDVTGTYKVEGDKFNYKIKTPDGTDQEGSSTIKTLTDEKLVTESKEKTESEWKKLKK
jgi:uncharacterized protein (TIGR03066 family)